MSLRYLGKLSPLPTTIATTNSHAISTFLDSLTQNGKEDTPDSYVKVIVPAQQRGTPPHVLYFGHTGNHYFALKEKISRCNGDSLISCCSLMYLNEDKDKVKACVDTLCRYLDNIRKDPEEEKYQKIKQSNKIFQERVAPVKGATEFLLACGFKYKGFPDEDSEEKFFVLPKEVCSDCERLEVFKEILVSIVDLKAKLDRCLKLSPPDFNDNSEVCLQPHTFSTLFNLLLPVEYLIGEMFWFQGINEAKQSDPDHLWSREHVTGSRAEGLCIPRSFLYKSGSNFSEENWMEILSSDLDVMPVKETFVVIGDEKIPIFDVIQSGNDPRYVFLRLTEQWKKLNATFSDSVYLNQPFLLTAGAMQELLGSCVSTLFGELDFIHDRIHGPARKIFFGDKSFAPLDKTVVFQYPDEWPESAMDWLIRPRKSGWPSHVLVQDIFYSGCHLAPVGRGKRTCEPREREDYIAYPATVTYKQSQEMDEKTMDESEWRISFSLAENKLGQSLSPLQRHIMVLLKIIKEAYLSDCDVISTYHLKNIFFWECENRENDFWREDNSAECLLSLMDRLVECLKKRHLPHYFMPESNLLMSSDPVKLHEAAKSVLDLKENVFQKTVALLTRLQITMFQTEEFTSDFYDLKVCSKLITDEKIDKLLYSLCQLFKKIIADEHRNKNENAMKTQEVTSIIDDLFSVFDSVDQFSTEFLFSQTSLKSFDVTSLCSKFQGAFRKLENGVKNLEVNNVLNNSHLWYILQDLAANIIERSQSKLIEHFVQTLKEDGEVADVRHFNSLVMFSLFLQKLRGIPKEFLIQARNVVNLIFANLSPLRLRVHESVLARCYCKLWFAKNGKRSEHSKNRETFALFVREDITNCSHLDEEFIKLSLSFFDENTMGRDSCQIVPETTVMEQVKEIQQSIAHECVKLYKTYRLLLDAFLNDRLFNDAMEMTKALQKRGETA
ncbi:hypothetical protein ACROYT_G011998 [Oculina patagonica]